ncbi:hypothetical protein Gogos_021177, partial [Gossypium gossypioides]|nr:hypothetical protein [Gossypium gossypioides]
LELRGIEERKLNLEENGGPKTEERRTSVTVYFDAAFDQQLARSVSGLVVRNERGEILASKLVIHTNIATPFATEAHAGLQALKLENTYAHSVAAEALKKGEVHYLVGAVPNSVRRAVEKERPRHPD